MKHTDNQPIAWIEAEPAPGTFRSVFKWGEHDRFKNPSQGFLKVIKDVLNLSANDLSQPLNTGETSIAELSPTPLSSTDIHALESIVGKENVCLDTVSRVRFATGKSMEDILKLRSGIVDCVTDAVVHPRSRDDVSAIMTLCNSSGIPIQVYGGGSSVTLGLSCSHGGVTLVLATHMNRLLEFNEINQTITVESGMMGPDYEKLLNSAPETMGSRHRYTGGHFPQSFEHSSVGGWVVTLGAGQASSYYGDACDLVLSQEVITPCGDLKTLEYPGTATGPKVNDILKGSEGCFGVLVAVTMKIFRYTPENRRAFSYMFPDFESSVLATREISQGEFGMPSILRVSDPEETDVAMKMYGLDRSLPGLFLRMKKLMPGKRCLLMGQTEGEKHFSKNVAASVKDICRRHNGVWLSSYPMKKWYHGRYSDAYLRDSLNDAGILIDTLETSVTWDTLHHLHSEVRALIKQHPHTICMTHSSHFYPQGTNLYFIFITRMQDLESFRNFQRSIIAKIVDNGGSLSHHHGVGKLMGPFMEQHLGKVQMDVLRALKRHFDPNGIMNPGGTLGLD